MPNTVPDEKQCPQCGKPMPLGPLAGLCPACLLTQGAQPDTDALNEGRRFQPLPLADVAKLFPHLEILGLLGAGGMGAVYKARQPSLDRIVALKILPAGGAHGPNFAERFNREARALARLNHPHIVSVHEFGQAGGLHYFIMEFVDGANLRSLQQRGRLSAREALQIIPQICDALQYAHDEGVVHRDIKPENVLVDRKGRVKIADFGLAKILGLDPEVLRLTAEGQVMGTPHYMAPEQIERPLTVDHRADIYSLGVVFYEMLTGDLPLGKFPPPSRKVQVDVRLDDVVLRALENDPARRYQHASEVGSHVQTIAATPTPSANPTAPTAAQSYARWLGFPVVIERDGKRHVNWKETLRVFALAFALVTLVYFVIWLFTRHSIPGGASLIGRLLVSVLIVVWGVGRAFLSSRKATSLPRTPLGTVILPRSRQRGFRSYVLGGSVAIIVLLGFLQFVMPKRSHEAESLADAQIAVPNDTGVFLANLPLRGTVELLAVSDGSALANEWWLPDGTPIPDTLYDIVRPFQGNQSGRTNKNIILRWRDLPPGASGPMLHFDQDMGGSGGSDVMCNGVPLPGGYAMSGAFEPTATVTTLRIGFGLEEWTTVSTHDRNGNLVSHFEPPTAPPLHPRVHKFGENNGAAEATFLMGTADRNWQVRVVAVDKQAVEHSNASGTETPVENSSIWTYTFLGLPLANVREFRAQVRPVHWVEFPNVALHPNNRSLVGRSVRPFIPMRYGITKDINITDLFDFDQASHGIFPTDARRDPSWARKHGFDAEGRTNELRLIEVGIVDLTNDEWDTLEPAGLEERFNRSLYGPPRLPSVREPSLPVTHGFRTRAGTTGLLQILSFAPDHPGVTLRYKAIERAHFE